MRMRSGTKVGNNRNSRNQWSITAKLPLRIRSTTNNSADKPRTCPCPHPHSFRAPSPFGAAARAASWGAGRGAEAAPAVGAPAAAAAGAALGRRTAPRASPPRFSIPPSWTCGMPWIPSGRREASTTSCGEALSSITRRDVPRFFLRCDLVLVSICSHSASRTCSQALHKVRRTPA
jgi:hypothetical protein